MKKYTIIYIVLYIILLTLVFTRGINLGTLVETHDDDYIESGMIEVDRVIRSTTFLNYNFYIVIILFITSLIITIRKSNTTNHKKLILGGLIILLLFVPVSFERWVGGVAGMDKKIYSNILSIPISIPIDSRSNK